MKAFNYLLVFAFAIFVIISGCDSATDSKPISVSAPVLVSPGDRDTNISLTPTFTWTGTADKLEIASNNTFTTVLHSAAVTGTSYILPSGILTANKTYYWHAGNTSSGTTYWSANTYSFKTHP